MVDILDELGEATVKEFKSKYGDQSAVFLHGDVRSDEQMKGEIINILSKVFLLLPFTC